ncbi:hypothetical protein CSB93_4604 [Pseudomonas paraeruginosa]|uniref:Uncharacterized protein n=1 Tax=Pseudomonas paraeruginosa TaxID=2994495 RepID=A0A2R3IVI8_9PSED|nr:hypothetical protein CSB93_4604 [Pseudomonas paraeruginosa]AWE89424.1 hypothetical protein CSC28_3392 [Pseudomonas paraeruginosa]
MIVQFLTDRGDLGEARLARSVKNGWRSSPHKMLCYNF